jgi:hypothetical protein
MTLVAHSIGANGNFRHQRTSLPSPLTFAGLRRSRRAAGPESGAPTVVVVVNVRNLSAATCSVIPKDAHSLRQMVDGPDRAKNLCGGIEYVCPFKTQEIPASLLVIERGCSETSGRDSEKMLNFRPHNFAQRCRTG